MAWLTDYKDLNVWPSEIHATLIEGRTRVMPCNRTEARLQLCHATEHEQVYRCNMGSILTHVKRRKMWSCWLICLSHVGLGQVIIYFWILLFLFQLWHEVRSSCWFPFVFELFFIYKKCRHYFWTKLLVHSQHKQNTSSLKRVMATNKEQIKNLEAGLGELHSYLG